MANLKNTRINTSEAIGLPSGTSAERPNNANLGMMRFNTEEGIVEVYNGTEWIAIGSGTDATGGQVSEVNIGGTSYRIHAFTSPGTDNFTVNSLGKSNQAEVLVVAGGGGGTDGWASDEAGSGGGAGEVIQQTLTLNTQTYSIFIGNGGSAGAPGSTGQNSSAFGITANGGDGAESTSGRGGDYGGGGFTGGEGGGGGDDGGGGGGAAESGTDATSDQSPGRGGNGIDYSNIFGTGFGESGFFGGGGGGGHGGDDGSRQTSNAGGQGGGGNGGDGWVGTFAQDGLSNTGGGGGGGAGTADPGGPQAGNGGDGIVLIRYEV